MQITIVQAEIETAIRDYIRSQVNVRPNMDIEIELRATRGAEGYQAVIFITPSKSPQATLAASVVTETVAQDPHAGTNPGPATTIVGRTREERERIMEEQQRQMDAEDNKGEISTESAETAQTTQVDEAGTGEGDSQAGEGEQSTAATPDPAGTGEEQTQEAPRRSSLFRGLKKPNNQS